MPPAGNPAASVAANATPPPDPTGRVAIVHNGIVENFEALRRPLVERGERFHSDTDTEVLAHLIAGELAAGSDLAEAVRRVVLQTEGAYSLVVIDAEEPGRIIATRVGNAGGIAVGYGDGEHFIASDLTAILPYTRRITFLEPGELADVRPSGVRIRDLDGQHIEREPESQPYDPVAAVKGRYKHFMLKEIYEQPDGALDGIRGRYHSDPPRVEMEDIPFTTERVQEFARVVLVGMGTSLHSAMIGRHYIERFARIPAEADNASEFRYRRPVLD